MDTPTNDPTTDPTTDPAQPTAPEPPVPAQPPAPDAPPADDAAERSELATERRTLDEERQALAAERAQLEAERSQLVQGSTVPAGQKVDLSELDQDARAERYKDWPAQGGSDLPQPWDLAALKLRSANEDLEPGKRNTVSPIVISHDYPILTSGSADPVVHDLGRKLGELGFSNSVVHGENPFGRVDESILSAVNSFRQFYGVEEDPGPFGGNTPQARALASNHIGPWTWEAVDRAFARL